MKMKQPQLPIILTSICCSPKPLCHSLQSYFLDLMTKGWPSLECPIFLSYIQDVFVISCLSLAVLIQYWFSPRGKGICSHNCFLITQHLLTYRQNMKIMVIIISTICESLIMSPNPEHTLSFMTCYAEVQKDSICVSSQLCASIKADILILHSVLGFYSSLSLTILSRLFHVFI